MKKQISAKRFKDFRDLVTQDEFYISMRKDYRNETTLDNINKTIYNNNINLWKGIEVSNFLKDIIKETGNEYASLVSDM